MKDEESGNRLGSYLRARRELVSPAQAGIPSGGNRRVPGLRREEVALLLSGISPDYYLRLERGRDKNPRPRCSSHSRGSCGSTTSSGRICSASRRHGPGRRAGCGRSTCRRGCTSCSPICRSPRSSRGARSTSWPPTPPWPSRSPRLRPGQNRLRSLLLDPEEQAFQQDWTKATADFVAALRTTIGDDTDNPRFVELVGELALSSQRFRTLWARHDVRALDGGTTTVHHPVVGELRLHRDKLPVDDVILVVYYPDRNSDSDERLRLLAALSHPEPADTTPTGPADAHHT